MKHYKRCVFKLSDEPRSIKILFNFAIDSLYISNYSGDRAFQPRLIQPGPPDTEHFEYNGTTWHRGDPISPPLLYLKMAECYCRSGPDCSCANQGKTLQFGGYSCRSKGIERPGNLSVEAVAIVMKEVLRVLTTVGGMHYTVLASRRGQLVFGLVDRNWLLPID